LKLLALDTSTDACTAAVWVDGAVHEQFEFAQQSARILPMVDAVLAEAGLTLTQLDAIAFGRGPGSFTGLRIAAGVVQGLAFGADLPVVPVSSLAALAQGQNAARVLAAFDARIHQVYWGAYVCNAGGIAELQGEEGVHSPDKIPLPKGSDWIGAGSGWDQYADVLLKHLSGHATDWRKQCFPHARDVAVLGASDFRFGKVVAPELALPVYLRDEVAVKQRRIQ
jgi:tRNA threonylcarbamoyladenosine biosynthesis protein TsaB